MFSYGLLGLLDPTSAGIVQSISNTFSPIITIFIPLSMSARTLLLFSKPLSKRMVMLPVGILFLCGGGLFVRLLFFSRLYVSPPDNHVDRPLTFACGHNPARLPRGSSSSTPVCRTPIRDRGSSACLLPCEKTTQRETTSM